MPMSDAATTIKSPGRLAAEVWERRAKQKRFKLTPERKLWLQWNEFVKKSVPQVSACDRKYTINDGDESRSMADNDEITGWGREDVDETANQ